MRLKRVFAVLMLALGILLFLTPGTITPVCPAMPDGSFMKCHWMDIAEQGLGAVIAFGGVLVGVLSFLFAKSLIGGCKMHDMACNLYTRPMVYFLSGLLVAVSAVYLLFALRGEKVHG